MTKHWGPRSSQGRAGTSNSTKIYLIITEKKANKISRMLPTELWLRSHRGDSSILHRMCIISFPFLRETGTRRIAQATQWVDGVRYSAQE